MKSDSPVSKTYQTAAGVSKNEQTSSDSFVSAKSDQSFNEHGVFSGFVVPGPSSKLFQNLSNGYGRLSKNPNKREAIASSLLKVSSALMKTRDFQVLWFKMFVISRSDHEGPKRDHRELKSDHLGPKSDHLGPTWDDFGPTWGSFGPRVATLGPLGGHLGPTWHDLEQLGAYLDLLEAHLA